MMGKSEFKQLEEKEDKIDENAIIMLKKNLESSETVVIAMNSYFCSVGEELANKIEDCVNTV